jgi:hypothetical protein
LPEVEAPEEENLMTTAPNSHRRATRRAPGRESRAPITRDARAAYDKIVIWADRANPLLTFAIGVMRAIDAIQRCLG